MTAAERKAYKENTTVKKPGNYDKSKSYANTYGANKSITNRTGVNETINQLPTLKDYKEKVKNNSNEDLKQSLKDQEKRENIVAQAQTYLDPNKKLTKEEQKEASKLATEGLKTLRGKKLSKMTEYEKDAYNVFNDLKTKSSTLRATAIGAVDKALDYGKTILKGVADTQSRKLAAENEAKQALGKSIVPYDIKVHEEEKPVDHYKDLEERITRLEETINAKSNTSNATKRKSESAE